MDALLTVADPLAGAMVAVALQRINHLMHEKQPSRRREEINPFLCTRCAALDVATAAIKLIHFGDMSSRAGSCHQNRQANEMKHAGGLFIKRLRRNDAHNRNILTVADAVANQLRSAD